MAGHEYKIKGCTFTGVMAQQQRIRLGWSLNTLYLLAWQDLNTTAKDPSWVEFKYLVFTRMAGHKYNSKGTLGWSLCTLYLLVWQDLNTTAKDPSWVEFMLLVFTRMAGPKYNSKGTLGWSLCTLYLLT